MIPASHEPVQFKSMVAGVKRMLSDVKRMTMASTRAVPGAERCNISADGRHAHSALMTPAAPYWCLLLRYFAELSGHEEMYR